MWMLMGTFVTRQYEDVDLGGQSYGDGKRLSESKVRSKKWD